MPWSARCSERSSAILLVRVVTITLSPLAVLSFIFSKRWGIWPALGRISTVGSKSPVGLINCSAIASFPAFSSSCLAGVADTYTDFWTRFENSGNLSGRLSIAEGSRNPYSTRVLFLERSPLCILLNPVAVSGLPHHFYVLQCFFLEPGGLFCLAFTF